MTLDDETARRIVRETVESVVWSGRYVELVRAGYAYRDAEVEELRAERDRLRDAVESTDRMVESFEKWCTRALTAEATLAKVQAVYDAWFLREAGEAVDLLLSDISDALDESPTDVATALTGASDLEKVGPDFATSPTERETPADREDVARVLRDADRPDVPAHLPPSRSYARMAAALMERFTITDGAHSSSVSITSPEVTTSDAVSGETPADEWDGAPSPPTWYAPWGGGSR